MFTVVSKYTTFLVCTILARMNIALAKNKYHGTRIQDDKVSRKVEQIGQAGIRDGI